MAALGEFAKFDFRGFAGDPLNLLEGAIFIVGALDGENRATDQ
jgi:hypothetical protein